MRCSHSKFSLNFMFFCKSDLDGEMSVHSLFTSFLGVFLGEVTHVVKSKSFARVAVEETEYCPFLQFSRDDVLSSTSLPFAKIRLLHFIILVGKTWAG